MPPYGCIKSVSARFLFYKPSCTFSRVLYNSSMILLKGDVSVGSEKADKQINISIAPNTSSRVVGIAADSKAIHEDIEIKCFYAGTSTLMVDDKVIDVKAGDVVVINPYQFHTTINSGNDEVGKYHLFMIPLDIFSGSGFGNLKLRTLLLENNYAFQTLHPSNQRLHKILMRIVSEYTEQNEAYTIAINGLIMELFALLIRNGMEKNDTKAAPRGNLRAYHLIEPALRCMRDNFQDNLTVEQLSAICNLSKSYFCRTFRSVTGKTAMDYLREHRLKIADALCAAN